MSARKMSTARKIYNKSYLEVLCAELYNRERPSLFLVKVYIALDIYLIAFLQPKLCQVLCAFKWVTCQLCCLIYYIRHFVQHHQELGNALTKLRYFYNY